MLQFARLLFISYVIYKRVLCRGLIKGEKNKKTLKKLAKFNSFAYNDAKKERL